MSPGHYVARVWSWTDRQLLWKIVSRPFEDKHDAELWAKHMAETEPHKNEYFVVTIG